MACREASDRQQRRPEAEAAQGRLAEGLTIRVAGIAAAGLLLLAPGVVAQQLDAAPPIEHLMSQLQARYDAMRDFAADFAHSYAGGVLQAAEVEHGTVHVKKPGRWRFDYTQPEIKRFVSNGRTIVSYFPADRQAIVSDLPPGGGSATPASFLAGDGDLTRDFDARYARDAPAHTGWVVELTPRGRDADYETLTLAIDPETLTIQQMSATDLQGGVSTYFFSNLQQNQGIADRFFEFDAPRGVEVITDDNWAR